MALSKAFTAVALKLQEQATELSHNDLHRWLSDACEGMGCWLVDVFGDSESGDVICCQNGDLKRCPYEIRQVNGKSTATIDMEQAEDVLPRTTYEPEADEADHMASMEAERVREALYISLPLYERFISKAERDAADSGSFAGKGKSFPILKPGDVMAAVHAMGRAGSGNYDPGTLKRNIKAIAKKKGWLKYGPKAWQDGADDEKEAVDIQLTGDVIPLREGAVGQDGSAYLKLIAPGRGSSGFYPAEVLKRDGPKIFQKGTKNFWDHQTDAEEAARPEGSLRDLASVLTEDAHYEENGPAGAGLYARAKVFEQFRQPVDDLAKHIGMSIRAAGRAREGKAPDGKPGPIIEELTRGISVDYVTTPGAGGQVLQLFEAARAAQSHSEGGSDDMTEAEAKVLRESVRKTNQRLALYEARDAAEKQLRAVRLPEAARSRILERVTAAAPLTAEGGLDSAAFKTLIETEVKDEAAYLSRLTGGRIVSGMGSAAAAADPVKQQAALSEAYDAEMKELSKLFMGEGDSNKSGRKAFREGRAA